MKLFMSLWKIIAIFLINLLIIGLLILIGINYISDSSQLTKNTFVFAIGTVLFTQLVFNTLVFHFFQVKERRVFLALKDSTFIGLATFLLADLVLAVLLFF